MKDETSSYLKIQDLVNNKKYKEAISILKIIKTSHHSDWFYLQSYIGLKNYDDAEKYLTKINEDPEHYYNSRITKKYLAKFYIQKNKKKGAGWVRTKAGIVRNKAIISFLSSIGLAFSKKPALSHVATNVINNMKMKADTVVTKKGNVLAFDENGQKIELSQKDKDKVLSELVKK